MGEGAGIESRKRREQCEGNGENGSVSSREGRTGRHEEQ
jgi:hypothetical protein